ncbi:MAG: hypothetical protein II126_05820, partial [Erysipelotrichaceae bacterium]|nr:hypothetical protein [Erysipelotrichaceae bacterium]
MNRKYLLIPLLFAAVFAGCNLPSASEKAAFTAQQTAEAAAMESLVQTAQAEAPFVPEAAPTEAPSGDPSDMLIARAPQGSPEEVPAAETDPAKAEPLPTADPNRQPPELPAVFQTEMLNKLDTPHTYEEDICKMIKNRWGEGKAAPGTIVMAIMYHGIVRGETVEQDNAVTVDQHKQLIRDLHEQGFTAINTEQF